MITLAFYKGRGDGIWQRLQDWGIRFATRSIYSHVELIAGLAELGQEAVCLSSSGRDGGVRLARFVLNPDHWDLVALEDEPEAVADFIRDRFGKRYDYRGILLSQIFALARHDPDKWFCSEICAAALGIPNAQRMSPQALYDVVSWKHFQDMALSDHIQYA
ncbi:hypothetical protein [Pseudooceanicola onchidii]|uniref:hypothetical protein n=1 Tax=Pseudooceanicola onchidii TaxID=2562279 RepID=UPI0010AAA51C|nr:hypothetical protein [Pseudooceanicola onchidii]